MMIRATPRRRSIRKVAWVFGVGAGLLLTGGTVTAIIVASDEFPMELLSREGFESRRFTDRRGVLLRESPSRSLSGKTLCYAALPRHQFDCIKNDLWQTRPPNYPDACRSSRCVWCARKDLPQCTSSTTSLAFSVRTSLASVSPRSQRAISRQAPSDARRANWIALDDISAHLVRATIAAEDRRFYDHFGIDLAAIARAAIANLVGSGTRQGASTITQQLVKLARPRPRTFATKLDEAILAMRLERRVPKTRILEEYLNRAPYGNHLFGVDAASRAYFGKPPALLSLAEAALLAGLPRAPSGYNPARFKARAIARQQTVLRLMESTGAISSTDREAALSEPLAIAPLDRPFRAPHFIARAAAEADRLGVQSSLGACREIARCERGETEARPASAEKANEVVLEVRRGRLFRARRPQRECGLRAPFRRPRHFARTNNPLGCSPIARKIGDRHAHQSVFPDRLLVTTTLDGRLQGEAEEIVRRTVRDLRGFNITNAAAVVLDNATGEILAYVGSADFQSVTDKGQVDGARARRQPGSTLKPFVYALAFDRGLLTPASLLADIEVRYTTGGQEYAPQNFDTTFHGPVRVREALANSYNIPAVRAVERVGVAPFLAFLRALGVASLDVDPEKVGLGAVLGNGEVTLLELTRAYAALARGGVVVEAKTLREEKKMQPQRHGDTEISQRRISKTAAGLVTHILADRSARQGSFGEASALDLPFRAAVKTGTSTNFRDNWTVGYTSAHTVGVWVGDFDARPLGGTSGVIGAAPIWRDIMLAIYAKDSPPPFETPSNVETVAVCPLSGAPVGPACPSAITELIPKGGSRGATCAFHHRVHIDTRSDLLAAPRCAGADIALRSFESYPPEYLEWAHRAGRPLAPVRESPTCPPRRANIAATPSDLAVTFPLDGDRFAWLPDLAARDQSIPLRARVDTQSSAAVEAVQFIVDGRTLPPVGPPYDAAWPLARGRHTVVARVGARQSPSVSFEVR